MLWRALGDVEAGFWIDAGAADPDFYSVTRTFSERGWRGINIEPTTEAFARLQARRPHDINLPVAVGAALGQLTFYDCADPTLSTLDPAIAERNRAGGREITERAIEVTTLAAICERDAPPDIHFLKVDVEGAEAAVLAGADFTRFRPWLLVIEATIPLSRALNHDVWEPGLLAANYRFAWFDGVNRFYIAAERWDRLSPHFTLPVNTFDDFEMFDHAVELKAAQADAERATAAASAARQAQATVAAELAQLRPELERLRTQVAMLTPRERPHPPGSLRRFSHRLREFLLHSQQSEIAGLRHEMQRLADELAALRRGLQGQLRPPD